MGDGTPFCHMLVPTRVGMIPELHTVELVSFSCPHTRGDDPKDSILAFHSYFLSPHAWG